MMTKLYSADKFEGNNDMRMLLLRPPQMLRTIPLSIFNCIAGNTDTHFILDSEHTETHSLDVEAGNRLTRLKNRAKGLISPANTLDHQVLWRFDQVIHPQLHKEYLKVSSFLAPTCTSIKT